MKQLKKIIKTTIKDASNRHKKVFSNSKQIQEFIRDIQSRLVAEIHKLCSEKNQFHNEAVSNYEYPSDYKPKKLVEQIEILQNFFPNLTFTDESAISRATIPNTEGWFVIPKWQLIAGTYNKAVERILNLIREQRKFYNWCKDELKECQCTTEKLEKFWQLSKWQQGDIYIIPAQFGLSYKGKSISCVRQIFANNNEFGLGAFETACMLLTHPERLTSCDDLWILCPGDEFKSAVPYFGFCGGRIEFGKFKLLSCPCPAYGSASFLIL